jgi:hypothetical protein
MATIKQQSKLIIEHPFFKESLKKMNDGDTSGFERLLMETMLHVWEKVALDASRVYGYYRRANSCDIKKEIRDMPPPISLDIRLPFVKENLITKTVKIKKITRNNTNQLLMFEIKKTVVR